MSTRGRAEQSIEELLRQMHAHEAGAVEELLRRVQPLLTPMAARHTGDFAPGGIRASDVSQEAAMKVHKYLPSFQGESEGQLQALLGRVVYSSWADMVRKSTRSIRNEGEAIALDDAEALELTASQRSPSLIAAQREQWRILLAQIKALPDDYRKVLSSYYFHGLSLADIAVSLKCSKEAVDSLLRRAVRALRDREEGREASTQDARAHNQLDAALASYIRQLEDGVAPEPEAFAAQYPDCADELRGVLLLMETLKHAGADE